MHGVDYRPAADFIAALFGETTEQAVEIRALPNERGAGRAAPLFSRDLAEIATHCAAWDGSKRAVYFGAATRLDGAHTGTRADLAELPALWVDIDAQKLGFDKAATVAALRCMAMPPSVIVDSGGGIHGYWMLREALDVRANAPGAAAIEDAAVDALKRLMGITSGDPAVCDLARIMRLPGTHNTKYGEPRLVSVIEATWARYEFDEIVEMLDWHRPVIERPVPPDSAPRAPLGKTDPFLDAAKRFGLRTPIDIETRLAAMTYLGDGDNGIHQTQLHVSASLVTQGVDDAAIVELLLQATQNACGIAGANWNWKREERNIQRLIASARAKFSAERPPAPKEAAPQETEESAQATGTNGGARVIDLTREREARSSDKKKDKDDKGPLISRIGDAVIAGWQELRGPIAVVEGQPYTYGNGIWEIWDKGDHHALRVAIQSVVAAGRIDPKTQLLNAVYRYVLEHPALMHEGVEWDASGLIVCQDGAIDSLTRATCVHSPDHWATCRIEVRIAEMGQGCPQWLYFLDASFSNLAPDDRGGVIATLQEWFGAAMVKRKPRELRKALWLYGESRTGKTRISEVLRLLIGDPTCALKIRALERNFSGAALIGKRAWIADDAVGSNDEVDDALFKCIVTGEAFSTDVKNADHQTLRLDIPVMLTSNPLPKVRDQSDAVFNRSLLIPMRVVRSEEETAGITPIDEIVAESELAGVFSWAFDGWMRAAQRGRFDPPKSMTDAGAEFKAANNVVASWAKESIVVDGLYMIDRRDAYSSFKGWFKAEYGESAKVPSAKFMMASLRQCIALGPDHKSVGVRYITKIRMSDEGLIYRDEAEGFGEKVGSGCKREDVNKMRPIQYTEGAEESPDAGAPVSGKPSPRF